VRDKLAEVQSDVKKWKHDTYKKQMVGGCKEAKAFEDEFRKVVNQTSHWFLVQSLCRDASAWSVLGFVDSHGGQNIMALNVSCR